MRIHIVAAKTPRVLMVVWNAIEGDSRVQKEAQSLSVAGCDVALVGVSSLGSRLSGSLGAVRVEVFPIGNSATSANRRSSSTLKSRIRTLAKKVPGAAARGRVRSMENYSKLVAQQIRSECDIENFDVVHIQDYKALELGLDLYQGTKKLVYDAHEYLPGIDQAGPLQDYFEDLEKIGIALSEAVITVSPIIAERIIVEQNPSCEVTVIRNTPLVDVESGPRDIRQDTGLGNEVPLVVYSGSVAPQRGLATLLDAMLDLESIHLAVVAPNQHSLDGYLNSGKYASLSSRLHVVPFVSPGQVAHYLRTADVAVHPMPSHIDGREVLNHQFALPNKWFEYVRAGLPVVVSDVEALSALVRECGNGEVFASNDPHSLADALKKVFSEKPKYQENVTQEMRNDSDWQIDGKKLVDVYSALFPEWKPTMSTSSENSALTLASLTEPQLKCR